jgi:hypothetical protein
MLNRWATGRSAQLIPGPKDLFAVADGRVQSQLILLAVKLANSMISLKLFVLETVLHADSGGVE